MTKKETINQYIDKNNCLDILLLQKSELDNLHKLAKELDIEKKVDILPYDPYNDKRADAELTAQELSQRKNMKLYSPDGRLASSVGKSIKSIKIKKDPQ